jgi:aconitate hydratase
MTSEFKNSIKVKDAEYQIYDLNKFASKYGIKISKLPYSIRVLLENSLRNNEKEDNLQAFAKWDGKSESSSEVNFFPARVLMQDFTGVPAVVDLAAMRDAVKNMGADPEKVNPLIPVDLVIDHSVMVDFSGQSDSMDKNIKLEFERNYERYKFLKWGQKSFKNFKVVPPGTGICHQVNLEYLANVVWTSDTEGKKLAYPDTLVGTDSHTTMINGLGVLGWGVGGIEAEAAMLGQPLPMILPEVIGVEFKGKLPEGVTATDLVLTVTERLRKLGVVGKFVEYFGEGLKTLSLADRATIANMAPEYGATCGFFPVDHQTTDYLDLSGRDKDRIALVEAYCKHQNMWFNEEDKIIYSNTITVNLSDIVPSLAGPKRPQDRLALGDVKKNIEVEISAFAKDTETKRFGCKDFDLGHGDVVIAAITSCTNTSNPYVMVASGLVAKKAVELGLQIKPWVKASLAPGSKVVSEYLEQTGLMKYLNMLKFNVVGFGCTTCIGNSGPLDQDIEKTIKDRNLLVSSVLSGNRNFEGRVHPLTRANYLASPPLVVAYAIAGTTKIDPYKEPIGKSSSGKDVYLKDIWPSNKEVFDTVHSTINRDMFEKKYASVFDGDSYWQEIDVKTSSTYDWDNSSTYIKNPPYFEEIKGKNKKLTDIDDCKILAIFGDSVTTDHISPAGNIAESSPAGTYLKSFNVPKKDFNSYGARRGNHEVMMRGTFANIRIKNKMLSGVEGGYTLTYPAKEQLAIYDAAMEYKNTNTPLVIFGGKEYGTGSSRDWAAKGTNLLGVKAVITESFERIHRSNLVGMGVLPLTFKDITLDSLNLKGDETISIKGINDNIKPFEELECKILKDGKQVGKFKVTAMVFTENEVEYIKNGGILQKVAKELAKS